MGTVYAREIEGVEHTFRVSGKLIMNALVMYDHQTNTLWSQFLIQGVKGPLVNGDLEIVPAVQTSWQQWVNLHPDMLVLDKGGSYGSDINNGYYNGGLTGIIGESNKDRRLPKKELVIGMTVSETPRPIPSAPSPRRRSSMTTSRARKLSSHLIPRPRAARLLCGG